jgi:hypothetical protein
MSRASGTTFVSLPMFSASITTDTGPEIRSGTSAVAVGARRDEITTLEKEVGP